MCIYYDVMFNDCNINNNETSIMQNINETSWNEINFLLNPNFPLKSIYFIKL